MVDEGDSGNWGTGIGGMAWVRHLVSYNELRIYGSKLKVRGLPIAAPCRGDNLAMTNVVEKVFLARACLDKMIPLTQSICY